MTGFRQGEASPSGPAMAMALHKTTKIEWQ